MVTVDISKRWLMSIDLPRVLEVKADVVNSDLFPEKGESEDQDRKLDIGFS